MTEHNEDGRDASKSLCASVSEEPGMWCRGEAYIGPGAVQEDLSRGMVRIAVLVQSLIAFLMIVIEGSHGWRHGGFYDIF